jgi:hypothetical protein
MILHNIMLHYLIYSEFKRIDMKVFWIYWKICTIPHCYTAAQCWSLPHYNRTAAHCRKHCHTPPCALPHTARQVHCRTHWRTAAHIPAHCRALPYCRTLPHCRTAAHCCKHCRTAAHCRKHCNTLPCALLHTAALNDLKCRTLHIHRTPHAAHRKQPQTAIIWHGLKLLYVNVYVFTWIL